VIEASAEDVRAWLISFASKKLSPRTYKRKLSSLKAFYKFLLREGVVSKNPTETVLTPSIAIRFLISLVKRNSIICSIM
jgi:integrase/recombinase XerC